MTLRLPSVLALTLLCAPGCDQVGDLGANEDADPTADGGTNDDGTPVGEDGSSEGDDEGTPSDGDGNGTPSDGDGNGTPSDGDGDGETSSPWDDIKDGQPVPDRELTAHDVCDRMIACSNTTNPSQYGQFFPVYGPTGTCWEMHSEAECRQACLEALANLDSSDDSCNYCESPNDCRNAWGEPGACSPGNFGNAEYGFDGHQCVSCTEDSHCSAEEPYCNNIVRIYNDEAVLMPTYECGECRQDEHCQAMKDAACKYEVFTCDGYTGSCRKEFVEELTVKVHITGLPTLRGAHLKTFRKNDPAQCAPYESENEFYPSPVESSTVDLTLRGLVGQGLSLSFRLFWEDSIAVRPTDWQDKIAHADVINAEPGDTIEVELRAADFQVEQR